MTERSYHNGLKTAVLLGGMWVSLFAIGAPIVGGNGHSCWIWILTLIGLFQTDYAYWNSTIMALHAMNAYPASQVQYPRPYAMVHELAGRANQLLPSIQIVLTRTLNASAIGRDPQHAVVCCTEDILQILGKRELHAALDHGFMHVYNRDILTSSIAAALGGLVTSVAQFLTLFGGGRRNNDRGGVGVLTALAIALLAPPVVNILQFSLSRTREFGADEDGARPSGDPLVLTPALRELESGIDQMLLTPTPQARNMSALMIANSFRGLCSLFSTRSSTNEHIARLKKMAGY